MTVVVWPTKLPSLFWKRLAHSGAHRSRPNGPVARNAASGDRKLLGLARQHASHHRNGTEQRSEDGRGLTLAAIGIQTFFSMRDDFFVLDEATWKGLTASCLVR